MVEWIQLVARLMAIFIPGSRCFLDPIFPLPKGLNGKRLAKPQGSTTLGAT